MLDKRASQVVHLYPYLSWTHYQGNLNKHALKDEEKKIVLEIWWPGPYAEKVIYDTQCVKTKGISSKEKKKEKYELQSKMFKEARSLIQKMKESVGSQTRSLGYPVYLVTSYPFSKVSLSCLSDCI